MKHTTKRVLVFVLALLAAHSLSAQYVVHFAGRDSLSSALHWGDSGPAVYAIFATPYSICTDTSGNIYIGDIEANLVRKITKATGIITTIAGGGTMLGDNVPATDAGINPNGICLDNAGNLYMADLGSACVRKLNLATGMIYVIAGSPFGSVGYSGDGGPAADSRLFAPVGVVADALNNIYISDGNNVVRKITAVTGIISTVAGNGSAGFGGDGGAATNAAMNTPRGMYIDSTHNLYIADNGNNRIRKVDAVTGIITTIAGNWLPGSGTGGSFSGDGGPATAAALNSPYNIVKDNMGNIYVSDYYNRRIRRINKAGIISTYAGEGDYPEFGEIGLATATSVAPLGMCFDACGDLLFSDAVFGLRAVVSAMPVGKSLCGYSQPEEVKPLGGGIQNTLLFPNPNNGTFTLNIPAQTNELVQVFVTDMSGREIRQFEIPANKATELQLTAPSGMYILSAVTSNGTWRQKVVLGL